MKEKTLLINRTTMTNFKSQNNKIFVFKSNDDSVVTNTKPKELVFSSSKLCCKNLRIWRGNNFFNAIHDLFLNGLIQFRKLFFKTFRKEKSPFFKQGHILTSFHQEKGLSFQSVNGLHKRKGHQQDLLPLAKYYQALFLHNSFLTYAFLRKAYLNGLQYLYLGVQQAYQFSKCITDNTKYNMYNKKFKNLSTLFLCAFTLTGCSSDYTESFSTEPGKGSGWKSMSETHEQNTNETKKKEGALTVNSVTLQDGSALSGRHIDRMPDETLKIWIAPYADSENNLFDACFVKTIVKQGEWVALK